MPKSTITSASRCRNRVLWLAGSLLAVSAATPAVAIADTGQIKANATCPTRLWISDSDWTRRRQAVKASPLSNLVNDASRVLLETDSLEIEDTLAGLPETRGDILYRLQALTVRAAMREDKAAADEALKWVDGLLKDRRGSDLGRSHAALHGAVTYAFCREHWSEADQRRIATSFHQYGLALRTIGVGNPDDPLNNWWGVTHSAIGLCLLVASEREPSVRVELQRETDRVASYLTNYGDAGHYYEGTGYGLYGFSFWGPFCLACDSSLGIDLARHSPGARRLGVCTHFLTIPPKAFDPADSNAAPTAGRRLFWNDDGDRFPGPEVACLLPAVAPTSERDWLVSANERLRGGHPWRIARGHGHAMWPLLYAPLEKPALAYGEGAPRVLLDNRTGLVIFRNRWLDADDSVFAVYAKASAGGGHQHEDAGSFRLISLGEAWASAGGQAKPAGRYQNVPLLAGTQKPLTTTGVTTGQIVYFAEGPSGGSVSVDLSALYGVARCRRHFAVEFAPMEGVEVLMAVWDEIIDRTAEPRWSWPLCYDRELAFEAAGTKAFDLRSQDGDSLRVNIVSPARVVIRNELGEPSERIYSEGLKREYPASRYALVEAPETGRGFVSVLTVSRSGQPTVVANGEGYDLGVRVGENLTVKLEPSRWFRGPLSISRVESSHELDSE